MQTLCKYKNFMQTLCKLYAKKSDFSIFDEKFLRGSKALSLFICAKCHATTAMQTVRKQYANSTQTVRKQYANNTQTIRCQSIN